MRLKKLVIPIVGFCAVSGFSSSAMAQLWAKNCVANQCLDATTADPNGKVQVSDCDTSKKTQQWHQNSPWMERLQNAHFETCLDMISATSVVTNKCNKAYRAQKWAFAENGQVGPIQNQYWKDGKGDQCLVVADGGAVTAEPCNDKSLLQAWYWVNVSDDSPCPVTEDSRMKLPKPTMKLPQQAQPVPTMKLPQQAQPVPRMKLPVQAQPVPRMKLPIPAQPVMNMAELKPICSVNPPGSCTSDLNECDHPSVCQCPVAYVYNPATGQCDYAFKKLQTSGADSCKKPDCSIDPKSVCTLDRNECGNPSFCVCPKGYEYNPATKKCDLSIR